MHVEPVDSSMASSELVVKNMHVVDVDGLNIASIKSARPLKSNKNYG